MGPEVTEISDEEVDFDRRALLAPVVGRVVDALGGYEEDVYVMGDQVNGCLKDLKKLWRKDETDDDRTVARLFWEMYVLPNDLVSILLQTAGTGLVEDKRAINCVDLMTAMTWPVDIAEELKELDEDLVKGADYTWLLESHLHYKAALLKPNVMQAIFGIMLPPLAKPAKERVERDGQVVNVVLHLIRNLTFIKDIPSSSHLSADLAEFSTLQSKLIRALSESNTFELLLTIVTNADNDPLFKGWNTLCLEIFYLLFRGVKPASLVVDQAKQTTDGLHQLLTIENRARRDLARKSNSRHSRFGTTISVKLNPNRRPPHETEGSAGDVADSHSDTSFARSFILHKQQAISGESGSVMDMKKRQRAKKVNKVDEFGIGDSLSLEAKIVLQNLATEFVQSCFNPFLSGVLKDIRSERPKITEKDNLRLLFVTKWFLEFFLRMRSTDAGANKTEANWTFGFVAEVTEKSWIIWILRRMRSAVEEKPKLWIELQAGIECLTQLLILIDHMSSSELDDPTLQEAAETLQQQLVYNGEVLDIALDSLKQYSPGSQSLAYLDSSVHLAYVLLRMLESWGKKKGSETYVRQKVTKKRRRANGISEEEGVPDVEEIEEEHESEVINETLFTFEAFEAKFAQSEIAHTLLTYLSRYREFTSADNMRRVVNLLHRQAVKAKAEGLFFNVSTLNLFKSILADQKSIPRDPPYKDLVRLINFILRQFFKAIEENTFLAIEALFPKNRSHWKQFSSWEPNQQLKDKTTIDNRFPPDVEVKKGYSWSDQLGIAIAALVEASHSDLLKWTTEESHDRFSNILEITINQRTRLIEEVDGKRDDPSVKDNEIDDEEADNILSHKGPSAEALAKITDYLIPYVTDEQADAATKNPQLKLLFRLCKFYILDEDADELEWYISAAITVEELQRTLNVIKQFLQKPIDLDGKNASQLMRKKRHRRRRRSPSPDPDGDEFSADDPVRKRRKEKKEKEKEVYKSAQFIEDSDVEYGDMDAFLEKEKMARGRTSLAAAASGNTRPANMKPTGTRKRQKKGLNNNARSKGRKSDDLGGHSFGERNRSDGNIGVIADSQDDSTDHVANTPDPRSPQHAPRPRPRPRLRRKDGASSASRSSPVPNLEDDIC